MAAYADKLWLIVAESMGSYARCRAYSSTDGFTWVSQGKLLDATPEYSLVLASFAGKLWRAPDCIPQGDFYDPYASPPMWTDDFTAWHSPAGNHAWAHNGQAAVVFDGKLWLLGGVYTCLMGDATNSVWWSADGADWTAASEPPWAPRQHHSAVAANGRIWVIGGESVQGSSTTKLNDVWTSPDGETWVREQEHAPWSPRSYHTSLVFNNRIWVIGGSGVSSGAARDVWYYELPPALAVTETPRGGWVEASEPWKLSAAVSGGNGPISYQWKKDGADIPGATDATYDIPSLASTDTGWYVCEISDSAKTTVQTNPVYLQVFAYDSLPAAGPFALLLTAGGCLAFPLLRGRNRK
jgi:hypothetical protein